MGINLEELDYWPELFQPILTKESGLQYEVTLDAIF